MERFLRQPLREGEHLKLELKDSLGNCYIREVVVNRMMPEGEGSTCLVYEGDILINSGEKRKIVLKEFYPKPDRDVFDIQRKDGKLMVSALTKECSEYKSRLRQFQRCFEVQSMLSNSGAMDIMVRPLGYASYGDSFYILSDIHMGSSLNPDQIGSLKDKLEVMIRIADIAEILHNQGYLFLDFCPENILYIRRPRAVKLFDVDSVICYQDLERIHASDIYYREQYHSPQIRKLVNCNAVDFEQKKYNYLDPSADIYSIGILLFQMIFGRFPSEEDLKFRGTSRKKLEREGKIKYGKQKGVIVKLIGIMEKALKEDRLERYGTAQELMEELSGLLTRINAKAYIPKKKIADMNYTYASYNILEKFPVFEYAHTEENERCLDVAIVGEHAMRTQMLCAVISCVQMLHARLRVHVIAEDALLFWEDFTSSENNPALKKAVTYSINGTAVSNETDPMMVDRELAHISLYTARKQEEVIDVIRKHKVCYVLALNEADEQNRTLVKELAACQKKEEPFFAGYLNRDGEEVAVLKSKKGKIRCFAINIQGATDEYDEEAYKSRIYRMGLKIHTFYYKGNHPRASCRKILEDYKSSHYNYYNIESSERAALHMIYKLESAGISYRSVNAAEEFYEKVLSNRKEEAKQIFDNLVYLEHRSWSAFMLTHGAQRATLEELKQYAYEGDADWKDRRDPNHLKHPCLTASRSGRGLANMDWMAKTPPKSEDLDPLDQMSYGMHRIVRQIAEERKGTIDIIFGKLEDKVKKENNQELYEQFQWLKISMEKNYSMETNAEDIWNKALRAFMDCCRERKIDRDVEKWIGQLEYDMRPVLEACKRHDFKTSDEEIVRAMPVILADMGDRDAEKRTIIKPVSDKAWQNVLGSLFIEPQRLVLLSDHPEWIDLAYYKKFFSDRGLEEIRLETELKRYKGKLYIDFTGVSPEWVYRLTQKTCLKDAIYFSIENRKIKYWNKPSVEMFNRNINFTVEETFFLTRAVNTSVKKKNPVTRLEIPQYISLWNTYLEGSSYEWHILVETLQKAEAKNTYTVSLDLRDVRRGYTADHMPGILTTMSGMRSILETCQQKGWIEDLKMPGAEEDLPVKFKTVYANLAAMLQNLIQTANREPMKHHFIISQMEETQIKIYDDTLYVEADIPHEAMVGRERAILYRDLTVKKTVESVNGKNKNKVFQNPVVSPAEGGKGYHLSFRYASRAVKEVLKKEGSILEAVVYFECLRSNVFDDIRINSEFNWGDSAVCNEVDVIGVKNGKTYFISIKMTPPKKSHLEEIQSLCERFSIDGQPVLISSGRNTGGDAESCSSVLETRSSLMKVAYINADGIISRRENGQYKIIVGETLRGIVERTC